MQDVFGLSCDPPRSRRPAGTAAAVPPRRFAYVAPMLGATVLTALILHLLADLAARLQADDPSGTLSVLMGVAAVLLTFLPLALLCAARARRAWLAALPGEGRR